MAKARAQVPAKPPIVFVDSDVIMDWLHNRPDAHADTGEPRNKSAQALIGAVLDMRVVLATSTLIEAEVSCNGFTRAIDKEAKRRLGEFFDAPDTLRVEVDRFLTRKAISLAEVHGLRGADALHLAAAIRVGSEYLMTHDAAFPLGKTVEGVEVTRPRIVWPESLFDEAAARA